MKKNEKCYTNRELSWLQFNERVLNEAGNPRVPLAERMTFASIYQTNLDEFFMVRVGTLMMQMNAKEKVIENKTGMTSEEQVKELIEQGHTQTIRGFKSKAGKRFDAKLKVDKDENGKIHGFTSVKSDVNGYEKREFYSSKPIDLSDFDEYNSVGRLFDLLDFIF